MFLLQNPQKSRPKKKILPIKPTEPKKIPKPKLPDSIKKIPKINPSSIDESDKRYAVSKKTKDNLILEKAKQKSDSIILTPGQKVPTTSLDKDRDGFLDFNDKCPTIKEKIIDFINNQDGCPDSTKNSILKDLDLSNKDLKKADFSGSTLINIQFDGANLRHAKFNGAILSNIDFSNSDLTGSNFARIVGDKLTFTKSRMEYIIFDDADIKESFFSGNLKNSKFRNAKVVDSTFSKSVIFRSDFTGSVLTNSKFRAVTSLCSQSSNPSCDFDPLYKTTTFKNANLENADLSCALKSYITASWSSQSWNESCNQFWSTDFENTSFRNVDLSGVLFSLSFFKNTDFTGIVGEKINFGYGNSFNGQNDEINKFVNANLKNSNFVRHDVWFPGDFSGADCTGSYFEIDRISMPIRGIPTCNGIAYCISGWQENHVGTTRDTFVCPHIPGRNGETTCSNSLGKCAIAPVFRGDSEIDPDSLN